MKRNKFWLSSAHRGFVEGAMVQNTLAAYYNAFLRGADMIETDARLTSDGVLIVNHDPTVTAMNENGERVTYTVAETPASVICSLILSDDEKWGKQYVPTLEQVLKLAYHTGMILNIDLKNGYETAEPVAKSVLRCGMAGKVIYALNRSGMRGIETITAIDPDARFIDRGVEFAETVKDYPERGKRCFCYCNTNVITEETVNAVRDRGCLLALISLDGSNFEKAMRYCPDMCEFLHTSDFRAIEDGYFEKTRLWMPL
ncbi:MAG: hypothetical protein IJY04_04100 [Clostridia bacterium]|nr:hypothetical protein [Clostridia bacterium]